ncbi:hypothetical protein NUW58_g3642 [Xylaria curta]|uniref:Uncharacterized protein n=1 Tax=Xylaria curta TaxID=42375 RepID=A0ACC1PBJ9_9PEZI|nr:hypothetical protein NUW58_g3642 [Xylaria curta]
MEVIGAIASFVAIGQAIGVAPKIIKTLQSFTNASKELTALIDELEHLYVFYDHMKENVDLFSNSSPLLRVDEPPYLKLVRTDLESLIAELQRLSDWCLTESVDGLKASKLRWWRKRKEVTKLRDECYKRRQQLEHIYMIKQAEITVQIHTRISENDEHSHREPSLLQSSNDDHPAVLPCPVEEGAIVTQTRINPEIAIPASEETIGRRCRCPCHARGIPMPKRYSLRIPLGGYGFLSYQSQTTPGGQCRVNCCAATQSFAALQFRIPIRPGSLAVTGLFKFGFPFSIYTSLTPTIGFLMAGNGLTLGRACYMGRPSDLNQWLSQSAGSILAVDEFGVSVLQSIVSHGGYSLLTYCISTWPQLIKGSTEARQAVHEARLRLSFYRGLRASDQFHLEKFMRFMEVEDDGPDVIDIICSENPIQELNRALHDTPDILTNRSRYGDNTILHFACRFDDVGLVQHLLDLGVPLDVKNDEGDAPLHCAVWSCAWQSAELLVKKSCDINATNAMGYTPLSLAIRHSNETGAVYFAKILLSRAPTEKTNGGYSKCCSGPGGAHCINLRDVGGLTPLAIGILDGNELLVSFLRKVDASAESVDENGWNILHLVSLYGDAWACQLAEGLEISSIDIRTTTHSGMTPLGYFRGHVYFCSKDSADRTDALWLKNVFRDNPHEDQVSEEKSIAFERLLRSVRDRMLAQEIEALELIISNIRALDFSSARDQLKGLAEGKIKAKIYDEAETFRAIDLDVREGRLELAIESIEEFIEASRDRMRVSPFDEEINEWELSDSGSENSDDFSEDDDEFDVETESEGDADWASSEDGGVAEDPECGVDEDREEDGWDTADEG